MCLLHVDLARQAQEIVDSQSKPGLDSVFYIPDCLLLPSLILQLIDKLLLVDLNAWKCVMCHLRLQKQKKIGERVIQVSCLTMRAEFFGSE